MSKRLRKLLNQDIPRLFQSSLSMRIPASTSVFPYRPQYAAVNVTDNCCFRCVMCDQWKTDTPDEFSSEQWKDIFKQCKDLGLETISFAGGEPFYRNDIITLFAHAHKLGLDVAVTTNGYLLDEDKIAHSIDAGVKNYAVSLDAVNDDFDHIRGVPGAYKRVCRNCEILARYAKSGSIGVHLYFTLMKQTLDIYPQVFEHAQQFGFPFVVNLFDTTPYFFKDLESQKDKFWIDGDDIAKLKRFQQFLLNNKKRDSHSVYHTFTEIDYFRKYFQDSLQKHIPCTVSQKRLGIDSCGNVYGGCWSMGSFGNLKNQTLEDIINAKKYKEMHKNMFQKKCPGCSCGYTANLRHHLPLVVREIVYRAVPSTKSRIYEQ